MYYINDILQMNDEHLITKGKDLEVSLTHGENHDIDVVFFYTVLVLMKFLVSILVINPKAILVNNQMMIS